MKRAVYGLKPTYALFAEPVVPAVKLERLRYRQAIIQFSLRAVGAIPDEEKHHA